MSTGLFAAPGNGTHYCGATAISAVTGMPITRVEDFVLAHRTREPVSPRKGLRNAAARVTTMWSREIEPVLASIGVQAKSEGWLWSRISLARWLRVKAKPDTTYIVLITGHFVAVRNFMLVDTRYRTPTPVAKAYARCRVKWVWEIEGTA